MRRERARERGQDGRAPRGAPGTPPSPVAHHPHTTRERHGGTEEFERIDLSECSVFQGNHSFRFRL